MPFPAAYNMGTGVEKLFSPRRPLYQHTIIYGTDPNLKKLDTKKKLCAVNLDSYTVLPLQSLELSN